MGGTSIFRRGLFSAFGARWFVDYDNAALDFEQSGFCTPVAEIARKYF